MSSYMYPYVPTHQQPLHMPTPSTCQYRSQAYTYDARPPLSLCSQYYVPRRQPTITSHVNYSDIVSYEDDSEPTQPNQPGSTNLSQLHCPSTVRGRPHHPYFFVPRKKKTGGQPSSIWYGTYRPKWPAKSSIPQVTVAVTGTLYQRDPSGRSGKGGIYCFETLPILPPETLIERGKNLQPYMTHRGMSHYFSIWLEKLRQEGKLRRAMDYATRSSSTVDRVTKHLTMYLNSLATTDPDRSARVTFDNFDGAGESTVELKFNFQASLVPLGELAGRQTDPDNPTLFAPSFSPQDSLTRTKLKLFENENALAEQIPMDPTVRAGETLPPIGFIGDVPI